MQKYIKLGLRLTGLYLLTLFCSCALMNHRYQKWDQKVTRNENEVLDYAVDWQIGSGENALLLVHGFGDGPHVWNEMGPELADAGYTVRAMRLPGWNESPEKKNEVSLQDWENAIIQEVETLKATHEKVAVLAHSMGGCLSTVLAQDLRLPADALILYAPMFEVSSARSPIFKTRTWFQILNFMLPNQMIIESMYDDHARVYTPRPKTQRDPFSPKSFYQQIYEEMDRFEAQAPELAFPLRLVLPGEDKVIHNPRSQQWFDALAAPEKTLYIDEPSGHVLPLDLNALAETDRIVIWLSEQGIAP